MTMALTLLRGDVGYRYRPIVRRPTSAMRRRRRAMNQLLRAIHYGLSRPDSECARQARLLADIFMPELGVRLDETRHEPLALHVVKDVEGDAAGA